MHKLIIKSLGLLGLALLAGCDGKNNIVFQDPNMPAMWGLFAPTSAFPDGGTIPDKYAAPGNISPPLAWKAAVSPILDYVVFVEDIDASGLPTVNWIVYGIPVDAAKLEEGASASPGKLLQGLNSKGTIGYTGMAPDSDKPHRYAFEVFALYKPLGLEAGADKAAVLAAMKGKVVAKSMITGTYQRKK